MPSLSARTGSCWPAATASMRTHACDSTERPTARWRNLGPCKRETSAYINALAFHRDGKWLAGIADCPQVWEVASGKLLGRHGGSASFNTLALPPDGKVVYGCEGGGLGGWIFDLPNLKDVPGKSFREPRGICSAVYSPDGNLLAFGTDNGAVHVWDFSKGQKQLPKNGHSHYISTLSVSSDGRTVLSGGGDGAVLRWDVARPGESKTTCTRVIKSCITWPTARIERSTPRPLRFRMILRKEAPSRTRLRWGDRLRRGPAGARQRRQHVRARTARCSRGLAVAASCYGTPTTARSCTNFPKMGSLAARPTFSANGKLLAALTTQRHEDCQSMGRGERGRGPIPGRQRAHVRGRCRRGRPTFWPPAGSMEQSVCGTYPQDPEETYTGRPLGPGQRFAVHAEREDAGFFRRRRHDPPVEPGARALLCVS